MRYEHYINMYLVRMMGSKEFVVRLWMNMRHLDNVLEVVDTDIYSM